MGRVQLFPLLSYFVHPAPPPPTVQKSSTNTQEKQSKLEQMGEQISHDMGKGEVLDLNMFDI